MYCFGRCFVFSAFGGFTHLWTSAFSWATKGLNRPNQILPVPNTSSRRCNQMSVFTFRRCYIPFAHGGPTARE
ncbi:hypothetical protein DL96DRAFT_1578688 [Flagelloscypha sp. PMI_526]|nr:hypothetical protein DL96DRAFT_1578688 [Flagelloscypha sp. PMI_526]